MSVSGLIISLILLVVSVAFIALPLMRGRNSSESAAAIKQREAMQMLYERALNNIRDLDEDHSLGKMPSDSYQVEREEWVQRGIQLLVKLDALAPKVSEGVSHKINKHATNLDAEIEAAIAAARRKS